MLKKEIIKLIGNVKIGLDNWDTSTPHVHEIGIVVKKVKRLKKLPDYFAACGYSGCAIGTVLSYIFKRPLLLIKNSHIDRLKKNPKKIRTRTLYSNDSSSKGDLVNKTYLFVDDLIDTGITFARIYHTLTHKLKMKCVGVATAGSSSIEIFTIKDLFENEMLPKTMRKNANKSINV